MGELFAVGAGKTMSAAARAGEDKVPFLRTSNVLWDEIDLAVVDAMAIPERELAEKCLEPGDLLVCEGGEIGRAAIWEGGPEPMSFQNHLHRLRPKVDDVDPRFYVYFLQSAFTQLGIFEGAGNKTTIPNLSSGRLKALDVPHPPLLEQVAIADALRHVQAARRLNARLIGTTEDLKAAAMQQLFSRGLRGEAQKETEMGPVPNSWVKVSFGDLGRIVTGTTPSTKIREYYDGGKIPFISPGDITTGVPVAEAQKVLTQKGLAVGRPLPRGTTLVVCIGSSIGKVGQTTAEASATNQQINAIVADEVFDPDYLFHLMTRHADVIRRAASPSPVPILSKGPFEKLELYTSKDLSEQREIARVIGSLDRKIELHRRKGDVLNQLFDSLLHKLMTGEVSVEDLDLSALPTTEESAA